MTKPKRGRRGDVIELVDEPALSGETPPAPHAPAVASFEDFYRRELPRLLVLARALAGDLAAEDVAQESMLITYRKWARIGSMASPVGYVRGICAHQAVSVRRRLVSERRAVGRFAGRAVTAVEPVSADGERFRSEVRRLPRRQAQVTALFYALDLPIGDIATTLGCAEGTVKAHLSRARTELAARLGTTEEPS